MKFILEPIEVTGYHGTTRRAQRLGTDKDPPVVVAARIRLDGFVDLLDQRGMSILQDFAHHYQRLYSAAGLTNAKGANRLDCAVFNFTTSVLSSTVGLEVKGYRAACVEGDPLTPGSPIFELSHVQIVVAYKDAILEKWVVPTDGKI